MAKMTHYPEAVMLVLKAVQGDSRRHHYQPNIHSVRLRRKTLRILSSAHYLDQA